MKKQNIQNSTSTLDMAVAYVLINVDSGSEKQVINLAKSFGNVKEAHVCFGLYDVMLRVEFDSMENFKELLIHKYRKIKTIKSILFLFVENKKKTTQLDPLNNCSKYLGYLKEKTLEIPCFST